MNSFIRFCTFLFVSIWAGAAFAQDIRTVQVRLDPGASGTSIRDTITGYESVSYRVGAEAGQRMVIRLQPSNLATYFNVYAPGRGPGDEAIANAGMSGPFVPDINLFDGALPQSGEYTISVYMMRSAARRNERSDYTLDISIGGAAQDQGTQMAGGAGTPGGSSDERLRFAPGTSGTELSATLVPGESRRYLLGAREGQFLYVRVAARGPGLSYQIFNPDGSFLLDQMTPDREYRGQLWQSGDHAVEVINRGSAEASYNLIVGIE